MDDMRKTLETLETIARDNIAAELITGMLKDYTKLAEIPKWRLFKRQAATQELTSDLVVTLIDVMLETKPKRYRATKSVYTDMEEYVGSLINKK